MKQIYEKVFSHPSLLDKPPVLIDIGASGEIHEIWSKIAKYSICIAFDADTTDFEPIVSEDRTWKKLYSLNRLILDQANINSEFYLTKSPYCSSALHPDNEALKPWAFSPLFEVEEAINLPSITLNDALSEVGINYIDWYKTDSQGTDLRIFDSLPDQIKDNIIAAEFEPGIIDAYQGEDKLNSLMIYMDKKPFWVTNMNIKGSQRINQDDLRSLNYIQKRWITSFLRTSPGWCEISYLNEMKSDAMEIREYLLAWIFSSIYEENGYALSIAKQGYDIFSDDLFLELEKKSRQKFAHGYARLIKNFTKRFFRFTS
tara:strand:- start:16059 stop:17003 length:945 start_codon:yes stop_codon:yes gene_type:complete